MEELRRNKKALNKVLNFQRRIVQRIIRVYRTTDTNTLMLLARTPPFPSVSMKAWLESRRSNTTGTRKTEEMKRIRTKVTIQEWKKWLEDRGSGQKAIIRAVIPVLEEGFLSYHATHIIYFHIYYKSKYHHWLVGLYYSSHCVTKK